MLSSFKVLSFRPHQGDTLKQMEKFANWNIGKILTGQSWRRPRGQSCLDAFVFLQDAGVE